MAPHTRRTLCFADYPEKFRLQLRPSAPSPVDLNVIGVLLATCNLSQSIAKTSLGHFHLEMRARDSSPVHGRPLALLESFSLKKTWVFATPQMFADNRGAHRGAIHGLTAVQPYWKSNVPRTTDQIKFSLVSSFANHLLAKTNHTSPPCVPGKRSSISNKPSPFEEGEVASPWDRPVIVLRTSPNR
ncbi:hypothetical protein BD309DRAFT_371247 [Dichomitus squalens]|nr:hypothetical protein BD309DRAFT_371247 [Dichomitus squalens]